jgi:hypothetical protein
MNEYKDFVRTSHRRECFKTKCLTLPGEVIAVYCEKGTEHVAAVCGHNSDVSVSNSAVQILTTYTF